MAFFNRKLKPGGEPNTEYVDKENELLHKRNTSAGSDREQHSSLLLTACTWKELIETRSHFISAFVKRSGGTLSLSHRLRHTHRTFSVEPVFECFVLVHHPRPFHFYVKAFDSNSVFEYASHIDLGPMKSLFICFCKADVWFVFVTFRKCAYLLFVDKSYNY